MIELRGEIEIHVREIETGEIVNVIKQTNQITVVAYERLLTGGSIGPFIGLSTLATKPSKWEKYVPSATTHVVGTVAGGVTSPLWVEPTSTTPRYVQLTNRFNPPTGSDRVISSIFLTDMTATNFATMKSGAPTGDTSTYGGGSMYTAATRSGTVHARALLASPCTQTTTQVLDVFYRVQWIMPVGVNTGVPERAKHYLSHRASVGAGGAWFTYAHDCFSGKLPNSGEKYLCMHTPNDNPIYLNKNVTFSASDNFTYFKRKLSINYDTATNVGKIFGGMLYGANWGGVVMLWNNVLPKYSVSRRIQPIHNHSSVAGAPFIDVDNLASGQGDLVGNSTNWASKDYPEFHRVDIVKTGEVGTARYILSKRNITGFQGNSYHNAGALVPWITDTSSTGPSVYRQHGGVSRPEKMADFYGADAIKYDFMSILTFNNTGVTWWSMMGDDAKSWDAVINPIFAPTKIRQLAVDPSKNAIWVGCRDTGVYRIDKNSTDVSAFTIPGVTQKCYGIDIGYNGSIWAVMEGGLTRSEDEGATWTVYNASSTPQFSYTGISDNNWSTVIYLRVDPATPTNQMILVRDWSTTVLQGLGSVWWSLTTAATQGPNSQWSRTAKEALNVSDNTSFWALNTGRFGGTYNIMTFNSGTLTATGAVTNAGMFYVVDFETDPYTKEDCLIFLSSVSSHYISVKFLRADNITTASYAPAALGGYYEYSGCFRPIYLGKGMLTYSRIGQVDYSYSDPYGAAAGKIMGQFINMIVENTHTGGLERNPMWEDYRWNATASQWQLRYHAPLVDSSPTARNGSRNNFAIESHAYKAPTQYLGSFVDISETFSTGSFTDKMTVAMTIKSSQPQTAPSILMEVIDTTDANSRLFLDWNGNVTGQTSYVNLRLAYKTSNLIFGAHPTDGLEHRVVFVINGTSVVCYLDGVQFGTSQTLASALDLANLNDTLMATLGATRRLGRLRYSFEGNMTNVQMWNAAWTASNVTYDFANQQSLITSDVGESTITLANLQAHFKHTEPLVESKATHSALEDTIEGVTLQFVNSSVGTSFVAGDYYTYGVVEGVLKDNATSLYSASNVYYAPTVRDRTDFDNGGVIKLYGSGMNGTTMAWEPTLSSDVVNINSSTNLATSVSGTTYVRSRHLFDGDFDISMTNVDATQGGVFEIGITTPYNSPSMTTNGMLVNTGFIISGASTKIRLNFTLLGTEYGDFRGSNNVFRIVRVGTVLTFYINGVLKYTSAAGSSSGFVRVTSVTTSATAANMGVVTINVATPYAGIYMGTSANKTGMFDQDFYNLDYDSPYSTMYNLKIDGQPIAAMHTNGTTLPGVREVTPVGAMFRCNTADVGKTLTGFYGYITIPK